ncbi:hypothetical protein BDZ94DRAFT_1313264 [Collybia nuda]|uniref:Uncharacterized protein n=1 Tax=Collybia nuda TaxID=64659 RepID=A0A9P5XZB2_9AGAR|nr:hypothetical protein BDZ94DRAFT_1313264 [Collybia nuda]
MPARRATLRKGEKFPMRIPVPSLHATPSQQGSPESSALTDLSEREISALETESAPGEHTETVSQGSDGTVCHSYSDVVALRPALPTTQGVGGSASISETEVHRGKNWRSGSATSMSREFASQLEDSGDFEEYHTPRVFVKYNTPNEKVSHLPAEVMSMLQQAECLLTDEQREQIRKRGALASLSQRADVPLVNNRGPSQTKGKSVDRTGQGPIDLEGAGLSPEEIDLKAQQEELEKWEAFCRIKSHKQQAYTGSPQGLVPAEAEMERSWAFEAPREEGIMVPALALQEMRKEIACLRSLVEHPKQASVKKNLKERTTMRSSNQITTNSYLGRAIGRLESHRVVPANSGKEDSPSSLSTSSDDFERGQLSPQRKAWYGKSLLKLVPPLVYDGASDPRAYHKFLTEGTAYVDNGGVPKERRVFVLSRFLSGRARTFYIQRISLDTFKWDLREFFVALFDYCFPLDYINRQRSILDMLTKTTGASAIMCIVWMSSTAWLHPELSSWDEIVAEAEVIELAHSMDKTPKPFFLGQGQQTPGPGPTNRPHWSQAHGVNPQEKGHARGNGSKPKHPIVHPDPKNNGGKPSQHKGPTSPQGNKAMPPKPGANLPPKQHVEYLEGARPGPPGVSLASVSFDSILSAAVLEETTESNDLSINAIFWDMDNDDNLPSLMSITDSGRSTGMLSLQSVSNSLGETNATRSSLSLLGKNETEDNTGMPSLQSNHGGANEASFVLEKEVEFELGPDDSASNLGRGITGMVEIVDGDASPRLPVLPDSGPLLGRESVCAGHQDTMQTHKGMEVSLCPYRDMPALVSQTLSDLSMELESGIPLDWSEASIEDWASQKREHKMENVRMESMMEQMAIEAEHLQRQTCCLPDNQTGDLPVQNAARILSLVGWYPWKLHIGRY